MELQAYVSWISSPVQIAFLDLVLGADNAIIIALVCRTLPRHQRFGVMVVGTSAALLLRIILTAATGALMFAPFLRIAGALVLVLIAISLTDEFDVGPVAVSNTVAEGMPRDVAADSEAFWDAILLVVLADGVMSLDNTVALAAVAKGDMLYLVFGLALSVPTLVFGSWLLSELLGQTPFLASVAMAVLAWVAGGMAVTDPFVSDWIATSAPALSFAVPIAAVVFVLGKAAFKPVIVPLPVDGPLDAFALIDGAASAGEAVARRAELPEPVNMPEPVLAYLAPSQRAVADESVPEPAAPPAECAPAAVRPREERLVIIGLIVLFGVAAVMISSAIYFGGATF